MTLPLTAVGPYWLAMLLVAAALVMLAVRRRTLALGLGLPALGGLALAPTRFAAFDLPLWLLAASAAGLVLTVARLLWSGARSFAAGVTLVVLVLLSLGAITLPTAGTALADAATAVRGLEFVRPWWLLLLLAVVPLVVVFARGSLSGLGPTRRRLAVAARAVVLALLVVALAEPRLRRASEHTTVLFVLDRSFSVPPDADPLARGPDGDPVDRRWERVRTLVNDAVRLRGPTRRDDRAGVILFGRRPKLLLPPAAVDRMPIEERLAGPIDGQYTDIAAALKLALASFPEGTGKRVVLVSDGNENLGRAEEQAALARRQGVEIDVIPLAAGYRNENEVLVQAVEAPPRTARGKQLPVRVLVRNANPRRVVEGVLDAVEMEDEEARPLAFVPESLDDPTPAKPGPVTVRLRPGLNVFRFSARADDAKDDAEPDVTRSYRATFTPARSFDPDGRNAVAGLPGDRTANNVARAVVVARGRQKVLVVEDPEAPAGSHALLLDTLRAANFKVHMLAADRLPPAGRLGGFLSSYDCLVLADTPANWFSPEQMNLIRDHVSGQGLGLVMVGGPSSFGPGGYQKTGVEDALPVTCDVKSPNAAGRGGLVLVMHASEMADGNRWQKEIAKLAVERLGPSDMVGVLYYGAAAAWFIPFQEVGRNPRDLLARIDRMTPGDMPDFDPYLVLALDALTDPAHQLATRHIIVISDGDPVLGPSGLAALRKMRDPAKEVTCTAVGVATHGATEDQRMRQLATDPKQNYYSVTDPRKLPAIYVREVRRVSRSFLFTEPFRPELRSRAGPTAQLPDRLPPLYGFVRTTLKADAAAEMAVEGPPAGDDRFPVLAYRQFGAGRSVAFTSDARSQPAGGVRGWDRDWAADPAGLYRRFWEPVIGWAMRSPESGRIEVLTEYRDGRVRVTVEARDESDRPVAGVTVKGAVTPPNPPEPGEAAPTVELLRTGPGRFEGEFAAEEAGVYFVRAEVSRDGKRVDAGRGGVVVPYSPEFADLETNPALLRRLAELTGGRVYDESDAELERLAKSGELFRDAPQVVRSLLPIWPWLVVAAGLLLVFDVGVRRVSVDPAELRATAVRMWGRLRSRAKPTAAVDAEIGRLLRVKQAVGERIDRERAERKFDPASAEGAAPVRPAEVVTEVPPAPPPPAAPSPPPAAEGEDFLSRMRKAKKRAQQGGDDEPRPQGSG